MTLPIRSSEIWREDFPEPVSGDRASFTEYDFFTENSVKGSKCLLYESHYLRYT